MPAMIRYLDHWATAALLESQMTISATELVQACKYYIQKMITCSSRSWKLTSNDEATIGVPGKKKLSLQEALDLLQNVPSVSNDALTDDSSDGEAPANYLLDS
ncbi:hypothetical protein TNCV_1278561 [Trichonephila clavipes]|nr:hypothetical protein TNCV_1278561 [Trichonephila clavipes]